MKILTFMACSLLTLSAMSQTTFNYPNARRDGTVDDYFGEKVADPYRWLEDDNSAETAEWVAAENKISRAYLDALPMRDRVKQRITELANYAKQNPPRIVNGKYYYFANDGLQNQSVLYVKDGPDGTPSMVLDPNTLSTDGTVALQHVNFSPDGKYMAYVITRNGSDWNEIYVIDLTTGKTLDDHIVWAKFTDAQWMGDGFFYSAYDAPKDAKSSKNEYQKVYYHKVGTPQSEDKLEYSSPDNPLLFNSVEVKNDGRYLIVVQSEGYGNTLRIKDMQAANPQYVTLVDNMDYINNVIGIDNGKIYVLTNENAPMYKIVAYDANNPSTAFQVVVPEKTNVISDVSMADHHFIITYDKDASNHPFVYDLNGKELREIKLPTYGSTLFSCRNTQKEVFYIFTSFVYPMCIYSYDLATGKSTPYFMPKTAVNPDDYETKQIFVKSTGGVKVPTFLIYKKHLARDGNRPTLVYGYGGFNASMTPGFNYYRIPFSLIDEGGVYAYTCLRGGGEYGEKWHEAGTKMQKQNVFDDFIAVTEWLIQHGYTNPRRLACNGASNGGLLVGAVVNQRPDLYAAAVPQVGVMDMLRYHLFTIGWNWAHDYGRSDDSPEMFRYLRGYSPLHNIRNDGTRYPAILVTTGDHDDRVVPAHSFKYAAELQHCNTGTAPKLIRIDTNAGHGHSKPIAKVIDEYTDIQSFIMANIMPQ